MADLKQPEKKKKVYTKPKLTEVRLIAEQAVLGLCKNTNPENTLGCGTCALDYSS